MGERKRRRRSAVERIIAEEGRVEPERSTRDEMLRRYVELAGRRIVDVGCGSGEPVRWLRDQGADPVGIGCGDVMMRQAREADPDHPEAYVEGVGQDLPLPGDSADAVVMSFSLHHVPPGAVWSSTCVCSVERCVRA